MGDYIPAHLRSLPWAGSSFSLHEQSQQAAIEQVDRRIGKYMTSNGFVSPFGSHLAQLRDSHHRGQPCVARSSIYCSTSVLDKILVRTTERCRPLPNVLAEAGILSIGLVVE